MGCSISFYTPEVELYHISLPVHGTPISSTRAELFGYMMSISIVRDLEELLGIPIDVNLGCDNSRSSDVSNGEPPKKKNADLEYEINFLKTEDKGHIDAHHIKTHQGEEHVYDNLPPDVQAQVRCHNRAKKIISDNALPHFELMDRRLSHQTVFFSNWEGVLPQSPYSFMNSAVCLDASQRHLGFTPKQLWKID